jgi:putative ABC transport system permease protein
MNTATVMRTALRALVRNKVRSFLTALGIIVGIAAVIAVVSVGQGATVQVRAQISSMGDNLVIVFPGSSRTGGFHGGAGSQQTLTVADGVAIARECANVKAVCPLVRSSAQLVFRENNWGSMIQGVSPNYPDVRSWMLDKGDFFTDTDVRSGARVCVLGATVAEQLLAGEEPVGANIRIRNMPFRVIGVLSRKGTAAWGQDQDDTVIIPWTTVRRVLQNSPFDNVSQLLVSATSMEAMTQARSEIALILRQRHRLAADADDDFTVTDMTEVTQMITQVSRLMTILLTVIASISLIVGGIGIMNIMLVSVTERTREIGLRMAVGARRRDILFQFLAEAIVLSGVGGIIGVVLGILAAQAIGQANHWPVLVSAGSIAVSLTFSAGVGVFFGFYPAWMAGRLNPIESLRHE